MKDPWFSRVWTLQELLFAGNPIVICGRMIVPWVILEMAQQACLGYYLSDSVETVVAINRLMHINLHSWCREKAAEQELHGLENLLGESFLVGNKDYSASDPRDKIFALLPMLKSLGVNIGDVNYSKSVNEVYYAATKTWIAKKGTLNLIYFAISSRALPELPSWAVDWSIPIPLVSLSDWRRSRKSLPSPKYGTLRYRQDQKPSSDDRDGLSRAASVERENFRLCIESH